LLKYLANFAKYNSPITTSTIMYLNTHTYYSLRYGTLNSKTLIQQAVESDLKTLVLTDINSTTACLDFVRLAKKNELKPILGVDFINKPPPKINNNSKKYNGYFQIKN
jgi:DNA polymerase III alpha subunit